VKLDKDLLRKIRMYSKIAGYSSVSEFITHALEKEIAILERRTPRRRSRRSCRAWATSTEPSRALVPARCSGTNA